MKNILMALLVVFSIAFSSRLQAQRTSYYYYPDANVYYNTHTHQYAYSDNGSWKWDKDLPGTVKIEKRSYVTVYGEKPEIWRDNDKHRMKYKDWDKKHGKEKEKEHSHEHHDR